MNHSNYFTTTPTKHQPTDSPASLRLPRWSVGLAKAIFTLLSLLTCVFCADTARAQEPLINGFTHQGTLPAGVSNVWTFTANAGDGIVVRFGEAVTNSSLYPLVRIYGPNGAELGSNIGQAAAEVTTRATNGGTFTVVAANYESGTIGGNGAYRITLSTTTTGSPVTVAPGDEGGTMTNGLTYQGELPVGDMEVWTFSANAGDGIVVRFGEAVTNSSLYPLVRIYGPNGAELGSNIGQAAAEVTTRATNGGTFTVVAANYESGTIGGNGAYRITLSTTTTGSPVTVAPGDEGGTMTNGLTYQGELPVGDMEVWTFSANAGDGIVVRFGEAVTNSSLYPLVRIYGPNGAELGSNIGQAAAEVTTRATNGGTFTVVAANYESGTIGGNGAYRITLSTTTTGSPVTVAPGDEGGALNGANTYDGIMNTGDLDVWSFTLCAGELVLLRMDELTVGSSLYPLLRLYGPNGAELGSNFGQAAAEIVTRSTNGGTFTVVAANYESGTIGGNGAYRLTVNGLSDDLRLCDPKISGTNVTISGVGGAPGAEFTVFTSPLVEAPLDTWTPLFSNQFDFSGTFSGTNTYLPGEPKRFFILQQH